MNPIFQLQRDISRYDADAIYYQDPAEHCRREAALLGQELEEEQTGTRAALKDARENGPADDDRGIRRVLEKISQ